jgi:hypothetical protein
MCVDGGRGNILRSKKVPKRLKMNEWITFGKLESLNALIGFDLVVYGHCPVFEIHVVLFQ